MRVYNQYILFLVLSASLVNGVLAFLGQNDLSIYFISNTIAYLVITILHIYLNPKARNSLNTVAAVFFAGFMVIVMLRVVDMIKR